MRRYRDPYVLDVGEVSVRESDPMGARHSSGGICSGERGLACQQATARDVPLYLCFVCFWGGGIPEPLVLYIKPRGGRMCLRACYGVFR